MNNYVFNGIQDNWENEWIAADKRDAVECGFDSIIHDVMNLGTALGFKTQIWINPDRI